jgi:hypothetical protein
VTDLLHAFWWCEKSELYLDRIIFIAQLDHGELLNKGKFGQRIKIGWIPPTLFAHGIPLKPSFQYAMAVV